MPGIADYILVSAGPGAGPAIQRKPMGVVRDRPVSVLQPYTVLKWFVFNGFRGGGTTTCGAAQAESQRITGRNIAAATTWIASHAAGMSPAALDTIGGADDGSVARQSVGSPMPGHIARQEPL